RRPTPVAARVPPFYLGFRPSATLSAPISGRRTCLWDSRTMPQNALMDKLVSLCQRRGYTFPPSEIHGGTGRAWDYGPLGVELKRNVKDLWWSAMVHQRDDVEGIDAAILMHPKVWEASGHVDGFTDPLVECGNCHRRFRADLPEVEGGQCPSC